jgi:hypothetical protein
LKKLRYLVPLPMELQHWNHLWVVQSNIRYWLPGLLHLVLLYKVPEKSNLAIGSLFVSSLSRFTETATATKCDCYHFVIYYYSWFFNFNLLIMEKIPIDSCYFLKWNNYCFFQVSAGLPIVVEEPNIAFGTSTTIDITLVPTRCLFLESDPVAVPARIALSDLNQKNGSSLGYHKNFIPFCSAVTALEPYCVIATPSNCSSLIVLTWVPVFPGRWTKKHTCCLLMADH